MLGLALTLLLLIILVPVGVLVVGKKSSAQKAQADVKEGLGKGERGGNIGDIDASSIPVRGFSRRRAGTCDR